jgi:hypothetical protein
MFFMKHVQVPELCNKTTKEHYKKYAELQKALHITFKTDKPILDMDKETWTEEWKTNPALNQIWMRRIDAWGAGVRIYNKEAQRRNLSMAEYVCLFKHCIIYDVIGAKPVFYEDWEGYQE